MDNSGARGEESNANFEGMSWLSSTERYQGPLGVGSPGSFWGDGAVGLLRSRTFTITGNSMNLLVGGSNSPDVGVRLVDANSLEVIAEETGNDSETLERRYWDLVEHKGKDVYLEVEDADAAGHISVDDITESVTILNPVIGDGDGTNKDKPLFSPRPELAQTALMQNSPNPFNPNTRIAFSLENASHVTLDVFDVSGARVRRLVDQQKPRATTRSRGMQRTTSSKRCRRGSTSTAWSLVARRSIRRRWFYSNDVGIR